MIDISSITAGLDLGVYDSQAPRAKNILSVQIGSLEYAPQLGIDLAFFMSESFQFQNESFKAYTIQVLAQSGINVSQLDDTVETLFHQYVYEIAPDQKSTSLIAR